MTLEVVNRHIEVRYVLDLAAAADHNVVDGAPVPASSPKLRDLTESAGVL